MRRRTRRRLLALAAVVAVVLLHRVFGDRLGELAGVSGGNMLPTRGPGLRVASWNLHNFPGDRHDLALVARRLRELQADVVAVQEVRDQGALATVLPGWEIHLSESGGRAGQSLGVAFDPARVELAGPTSEHKELTLGGRLRPAFHAYLRARDGGPDVHVVVVHLKAFPDGIDQRRRQWRLLAKLTAELTRDDADLILLGDFNTTGAAGGSTAAELAELDAAVGSAGLRRLEPAQACTAYWDGARRDAWKEPSVLDHVLVAGLAEAPAIEVVSSGLCARRACEPLRSTEAYPDAELVGVSDHCPLVLDLPRADDD